MTARDFALFTVDAALPVTVIAVEAVAITWLVVHFVFGTAFGRLLLCYAGG